MLLFILFHFLCVQHVSDINISIIRSLRLFRCVSASNPDTTPTQPHRNSNTHRTKNNTTNVVIQRNSRKLLMMAILMSETCWAHKKWNKIASDIKLVFHSSAIPLCFSIDRVLNFLLSWLLVLIPSTFFLDVLFPFSHVVTNPKLILVFSPLAFFWRGGYQGNKTPGVDQN